MPVQGLWSNQKELIRFQPSHKCVVWHFWSFCHFSPFQILHDVFMLFSYVPDSSGFTRVKPLQNVSPWASYSWRQSGSRHRFKCACYGESFPRNSKVFVSFVDCPWAKNRQIQEDSRTTSSMIPHPIALTDSELHIVSKNGSWQANGQAFRVSLGARATITLSTCREPWCIQYYIAVA